jgi:hypothetical protein
LHNKSRAGFLFLAAGLQKQNFCASIIARQQNNIRIFVVNFIINVV